MKKISLKSIKPDEFLSREELKIIIGGSDGSGGGGGDCRDKACSSTPGDGLGASCTSNLMTGTCVFNSFGIWGCDARTLCTKRVENI